MDPLSAIVVVHPGVEELECVAPVDVLRRAGVQVTLARCGEAVASGGVAGKNGIVLHPDTTLEAVAGQAFDLVVVPGGPGVQALRQRPEALALLRAQAARGGWIGCICAAPLLLKDAGLLEGGRDVRYTAHPSVLGELPAAAPEAVVRDGRLITSRGAGTAVAFGLALVEALLGPEKAREIADSIVFSGDFSV